MILHQGPLTNPRPSEIYHIQIAFPCQFICDVLWDAFDAHYAGCERTVIGYDMSL